MGLCDQRRRWIISYHWLDCILLSAGSYRIVDWVVLYRLDWIVSYRLDHLMKHWLLCDSWLLAGWEGWTGWGVGGTRVGRNDVSRRRNGSATIGSGTGAPPLALEGRGYAGSGGWHQLCRCCKGTEYFCCRIKIVP